jgi:hypothetical protein
MSPLSTDRRETWITGIGLVSSLGDGLEANWDALRGGRVNIDLEKYAPWMIHPLAPLNLDNQIPKRATSARWKHGSASAPTQPDSRWIPPASSTTKALLDDREMSKQLLDLMPLRKFADTTDVAAAVLYLASPAAKVVTGHVLAVDGGYLAR